MFAVPAYAGDREAHVREVEQFGEEPALACADANRGVSVPALFVLPASKTVAFAVLVLPGIRTGASIHTSSASWPSTQLRRRAGELSACARVNRLCALRPGRRQFAADATAALVLTALAIWRLSGGAL